MRRELIIVSKQEETEKIEGYMPKISVEISVSFPPNAPTARIIQLIDDAKIEAFEKVLRNAR